MIRESTNRTKIARRVVEVLDYFDEAHPRVTVMDIVRCYDWPQSSTSELLKNLVDIGILSRDRTSRTYSPTPRSAMLANTVQPEIIRSGQLMRLIDRIAMQTGLSVAVFGIAGLNVQIYSWRKGNRMLSPNLDDVRGGQRDSICHSAVGQLLLSTVAMPRRDSIIRHVNAEASPDRKFSFPNMVALVEKCARNSNANGPFGFGSSAEIASVLLPQLPMDQPMAIGCVYQPSPMIDPAILLHSLTDTVAACIGNCEGHSVNICPILRSG